MIDKKTPTELSSFRIVDDSSDSQNEIKNVTENNHADPNLHFNENCPLPRYSTDTLYSQLVVTRANKARDELI